MGRVARRPADRRPGPVSAAVAVPVRRGLTGGHGHPAVPRTSAALDRGAASPAHRGGELPGRAGPGTAACPAFSHLQHLEPGTGPPQAGDLAAGGLAVHQAATVDLVHLWRRRAACARRGGMRVGHPGGQRQHACAGHLAAAHAGHL